MLLSLTSVKGQPYSAHPDPSVFSIRGVGACGADCRREFGCV